jgi:ribonuclease BN (tRNA processing enzyme)
MRLTILGSGTVVPDGRRNSSGYFLESGTLGLMLDCGAGTVHSLARYGLPWERMSHLFLSHFHVDHCGELPALFRAFKHGLSAERREPLTIVAPQGIDRVMNGLRMAFSPSLFEPGFPVEVVPLEPNQELMLGTGRRLTAIKTPHNRESLAVRIEAEGRSLCYTGDTEYSDELCDFFRNADLLVSECSLLAPRQGMRHVTVDDVGRLAGRSGARRLAVTHFYFKVDHSLEDRLRLGYPGEILIGEDGMRIEV